MRPELHHPISAVSMSTAGRSEQQPAGGGRGSAAGPTLAASAVARLTGLATWRLLELEPVGFGCPRDRVRFGGEDHYTVPGAWRLVTILREAGEAAAAERLQALLAETHPEPTPVLTHWWQQSPYA